MTTGQIDWRQAIVPPTNINGLAFVQKFADIATTSFDSSIQAVTTAGYYAPGDCGEGYYVPTANTGSKLYRAQSLDGRWWELSVAEAWIDRCGGVSYDIEGIPAVPFDSLPAWNAMIEYNHARNGGVFGFRRARTYCFSNTIQADPSLDSFEGNSGCADFRLKNFIDPASQPELLSDPGFDVTSGSPWIAGAGNNAPYTISGSQLRSEFLEDGVTRYLEIGQMIPCLATDIIRIVFTVEEISKRTVGINTSRAIKCTLRKNQGRAPATDIAGGALLDTVGTITAPLKGDFPAGSVYSFELTAKGTNPYLRFQSSAQIRISSISIKVVPRNECMLIRSTPDPGNTRGHNWKNFRNFRIIGKSGVQRDFVDGILFDTPAGAADSSNPRSSRANFYNVDISDVGRSIVLGNNTYLNNFNGCRFVATKVCIDSLQNTTNAGENIAFFGGSIGGAEIGIRNIGPMALRFEATSIDFVTQFIVGGKVNMWGAWLETKNSQVVDGKPIINASTGDIHLYRTRITVGGTPGETPVQYMFNVDDGYLLHIEAENPFNLITTTDAMCSGEGRFYFKGQGGENKAIATITKRDSNHNILHDSGGFEGSEVEVLAWSESVPASGIPAAVQISRQLLGFATPVQKNSASYNRGDAHLTVGTNTNILAGMTVRGLGIKPETVVLAVDGTTIRLSKRVTATVSVGVVNFMPTAMTGIAGLEVSASEARTGAQSLRFFKNGAPTGTNIVCSLAVPIEHNRAIGGEMWVKVPSTTERAARGLAGFSGSSDVIFNLYFARIEERGDNPLPLVIPQTSRLFLSEQSLGTIDLAAGLPWTRINWSTNRYDDSTKHRGYVPEWATHMQIILNISGKPDTFEMFLDDLHVNMM